jgi:PAS domain S-box-containing protein
MPVMDPLEIEGARKIPPRALMNSPAWRAFLLAAFLAVILIPYWWLATQWSGLYFSDPGVRFTFVTTTFLLVLIIADSAFLIRYYQIIRTLEFGQQARELRQSEEKYRMIIENMQDMFYRTDMQGRITMISPAGVKLAGYNSPEELIGLNARDMYVEPGDRDRLLALVAEKGEVSGYPLRLRRRDGAIRLVTTSSHFYRDTDGTVQGMEGIIHDITELRQAEDGLLLANRKLNLLSSITRHDIRNQLMALKTYLQLNEDAIDKPAELADYFIKEMKIADNIERQITFTRDYEDLGVNAPSWQNVDSVVRSAMAGVHLGILRVTVDTSGIEVNADALFEKVFYNLFDNALRYGGSGLSAIRISSREGPGGSLVISFEDNGAGIEAGDKAHLFAKGFGKNTGLGLFLSSEILSITGITIAENGIPGQGARFEMTVPKECYRSGTQNGSS